MSASDDQITRYEQAAEWLQTLHACGDDEKTLERWIEWCAEDPRNQQAFDQLSAVWIAAGDGGESPAQPRWQHRTSPRPKTTRWFPSLAAGLASIALGLGITYWATRPAAQSVAQTWSFESPRGVNTIETLQDRSILELGGNTHADVAFRDDSRRVQLLDGEMFVSVTKDPSRPFVVTAGQLQITAVGTAFNVRRVGTQAVVTVTEGTVEVARQAADTRTANISSPTRTRLDAGQQLQSQDGSSSMSVRWVDPAAATAWRNGVLKFIDEPLSLVISSINRYSAHEIVIRDPDVGRLAFTGTARVDRIDNWLHGLQSVFPVTVVELADGRRLLAGRASKQDRVEPDVQ